MPTEAVLEIRADLNPREASEACRSFASQIATSGPLLIEFDAEDPTIFALQIAISCKRSLEAADHFLGFGPIAQRCLGNFLNAHQAAKEPV